MRYASLWQEVRKGHEITENIQLHMKYKYMTILFTKFIASTGLNVEWHMQKAVTAFLSINDSIHAFNLSVPAHFMPLLI